MQLKKYQAPGLPFSRDIDGYRVVVQFGERYAGKGTCLAYELEGDFIVHFKDEWPMELLKEINEEDFARTVVKKALLWEAATALLVSTTHKKPGSNSGLHNSWRKVAEKVPRLGKFRRMLSLWAPVR